MAAKTVGRRHDPSDNASHSPVNVAPIELRTKGYIVTGSFTREDAPHRQINRLPAILPLTALACIAAAGLYSIFGAAATLDGAMLLLLGVFLAMSSLTVILWQRLEQGLGAAPALAHNRRRVRGWRL